MLTFLVTSSWAYHQESKTRQAEKDFKKLNKMGAAQATDPKKAKEFRKEHDVRVPQKPVG